MSDTEEEVLAAAGAVLEHVASGDAEAIASRSAVELTRFANNVIHQNVAETGLRLRARVMAENRVGVGELRGEGDDTAARVAAVAEEARRIMEESDTAPLPRPDGGADGPVAFSDATAEATPEQRADLVAVVTRAASARGLVGYGYVSTQRTSTAILNTSGVRRSATSAQASMVALMRGASGSGYAARHSADIASIDVEALAEEAVQTCERNQDAQPLEPGTYEVVLSPYAVTELLGHLSWVGFSALAKQEQRSFMRIGERLMSPSVTIVDDCRDVDVFPYPFDDEGVSTRVLPLIENGVCRSLVYDTPTAVRDGVQSTGHALPQPNVWGPLARHVTMSAGDATLDEMISGVKRGLYITRFWYVRDVHPLRTIITGMTRDGTFLIEDGVLGRPVKDLRFTQGMVDALSDVRAVSRDRILELDEGESGVLAPWLHLGHFTFTS